MATARLTIGTLLNTVGVAASSVTAVLQTGVKGIDMVDLFVSDALNRQQVRSLVDMENFESALQEEKAQEMTERQLSVREFCSQSAQHAADYEVNYNRIGAILAKRHAAQLKAA